MFSQIFILPKLEVKPVLVIDSTIFPVPATLSTDPVAETPEGLAVAIPTATSVPTEAVPETPVGEIRVTKLIVTHT